MQSYLEISPEGTFFCRPTTELDFDALMLHRGIKFHIKFDLQLDSSLFQVFISLLHCRGEFGKS